MRCGKLAWLRYGFVSEWVISLVSKFVNYKIFERLLWQVTYSILVKDNESVYGLHTKYMNQSVTDTFVTASHFIEKYLLKRWIL